MTSAFGFEDANSPPAVLRCGSSAVAAVERLFDESRLTILLRRMIDMSIMTLFRPEDDNVDEEEDDVVDGDALSVCQAQHAWLHSFVSAPAVAAAARCDNRGLAALSMSGVVLADTARIAGLLVEEEFGRGESPRRSAADAAAQVAPADPMELIDFTSSLSCDEDGCRRCPSCWIGGEGKGLPSTAG